MSQEYKKDPSASIHFPNATDDNIKHLQYHQCHGVTGYLSLVSKPQRLKGSGSTMGTYIAFGRLLISVSMHFPIYIFTPVSQLYCGKSFWFLRGLLGILLLCSDTADVRTQSSEGFEVVVVA